MILGDSMASRMERYYKSNDSSKKRSQLNKKLYDSIYEESEYSNIEAIATMSKPNEIDITKVKQMLKSREDYKKQKQYRQIMNQEEEKKEPTYKFEAEEIKSYDVKDLLNQVKDKEPESEYRRLDNTNYNILKELKIHKEKEEEGKNELTDMIDTITNTSKLHKLDNKELGLDLLSDLKGNDDTIIEDRSAIRSLIEEARMEETKKGNTTNEFDDSFYSASMHFNKSDFMDFDDVQEKKFYQTTAFKVIMILLFIVIVVGGVLFFIL